MGENERETSVRLLDRHIGHRETEMERKRQRGKESETEETERVRLTSYCVYEAVVTHYNVL